MAKEKNENNETPAETVKESEKELRDALEALKNEYAALGKTLEDTKAELSTRNDSYVRITAEYENYRKRTAAEKAAIYADAYAGAAELFLPMADALDRAAELAARKIRALTRCGNSLPIFSGGWASPKSNPTASLLIRRCTTQLCTRMTNRSPKAPLYRPSSAATGWVTR